jgi:hypothetical protein
MYCKAAGQWETVAGGAVDNELQTKALISSGDRVGCNGVEPLKPTRSPQLIKLVLVAE